MKKILLLILCLVLVVNVEAATTISGRPCPGGAATCTTPTADVMSEGFEGCAEDGSSGCDATWATTGSGVEYNYSLPGSPPTGSCSKGLRVNADGGDYAVWDRGSGLTTYWVKFPLYIASHSFSNFQTGTLFSSGSSSGAVMGIFLQLYNLDGTMSIRANNTSSSSSATSIGVETWHTIEMCVTDGGIGSDPCGSGTNGMGWYKVDGGDAVTLACADIATNAQRYFSAGMGTASRTVDIIIPYILIDDDGTY